MLKSKVELIHNAARVNYKGSTIQVQYGPFPEIVNLVEQDVKKILINMKEVDYFTSAGISNLLATIKLANEKGAQLAIYNLQGQVEETIRRTGLKCLIPFFDNEQEAANYVGLPDDIVDSIKHQEV